MTTTVTALFESYTAAKPAVDALEKAGISSSDISVIANNANGAYVDKNHTNAGPDAGVGAGMGAVVGGAGGLLAGLGLMAIPGVGPVVAAGWLVATAVGAVGGAAVGAAAGGIVGSMTNAGVDEREAHLYAEGVRRGGALVAARVDDDDVLCLYPAFRRDLEEYQGYSRQQVASRGDHFHCSSVLRVELPHAAIEDIERRQSVSVIVKEAAAGERSVYSGLPPEEAAA